MSDPCSFVLIKDGTVSKGSARICYGLLYEFAKGPEPTTAWIEKNFWDEQIRWLSVSGCMIDFDNQLAIVFGSNDIDGADPQVGAAINNGSEAYLRAICSSWNGWDLRWGEFDDFVVAIRKCESDQPYESLDWKFEQPPPIKKYAAARSHIDQPESFPSALQQLQANPYMLGNLRHENETHFSIKYIATYPELPDRLPDPQLLEKFHEVQQFRGSLFFHSAFSMEAVKLLRSFRTLTVSFGDWRNGRFEIQLSHQKLVVRVNFHEDPEDPIQPDLGQLNRCFEILQSTLTKTGLSEFESDPIDNFPAAIFLTHHIPNCTVRQFCTNRIPTYTIEFESGDDSELEAKFVDACSALPEQAEQYPLELSARMNFKNQEDYSRLKSKWRQTSDLPLQAKLSLFTQIKDPIKRPVNLRGSEYISLPICMTRAFVMDEIECETSHPLVWVNAVHTSSESYLEYCTESGMESLKTFLDIFDFDVEFWEHDYANRWTFNG